MNNTVKENKEISKLEARVIQYSKILFMFLGLIMFAILLYKMGEVKIMVCV